MRTCLACVQNHDKECGENPGTGREGKGQMVQGFLSHGKELEFLF